MAFEYLAFSDRTFIAPAAADGVTFTFSAGAAWLNTAWVEVLAANADPVAIGEVVLATSVRTFERNVAPGLDDDEDHPLVEHRTDHGVSTVYDLGTMWRTWSGTMPAVTDTGIAAYRSLTRAARGRARPFIFVPDPSVNDAWYARLGNTSSALQRYKKDVSAVPVEFQELSRGLPL
jgi:hypothetical protein